MATEKRLIYLDHALQAVSENYRSDMPKHDLDMLVDTRKRLKAMPTVDAVEVVRCEHCVHGLGDGWICGGPSFTMPSHPTYPDAFCSYGERKGND